MTGIRASFVVHDATECPVARASAETEGEIDSVARSARVGADAVVEEFELSRESSNAPALLAGDESETLSVDGARRVFAIDGVSVYRFRREATESCPCAIVESSAETPVTAVRAENGSLFLWLYAPDVASVRTIVADLRSEFDEVELRHLVRENEGDGGDDYVLVNRSRLTERQREVVRTAFAMGYFDYDSGTNAGDVASALGISHSTFAEHLSAAQTKLLEPIVSEAP